MKLAQVKQKVWAKSQYWQPKGLAVIKIQILAHFWSKFFFFKLKILIFFLQNSFFHFVFTRFRVFRGKCGIMSEKGQKSRGKNKVLKLRGTETHFSAVRCGQKTIVCDFCHSWVHSKKVAAFPVQKLKLSKSAVF